MTQTEFRGMLEQLASAWREKRYDDAAACFAQEIFYCDPLNYRWTTAAQLIDFFKTESEEESCTFHAFVFDEAAQRGAAEYTYSGTNRYHGTVWVDLEDDKIVSWREYQHRSEKSWKEFWNK